MSDDKHVHLGICPKCASADCTCMHETVSGYELWVWSECGSCGYQFVEIFRRVRVDGWEEHR